MARHKVWTVAWVVASWIPIGVGMAADGINAAELAAQIGVNRGICVVLGDRDGRLACQLARQTELVLLVQLEDAAEVEAASKAADAAGVFGTRIIVEKGSPERIGLADNLADAVIVLGDRARLDKSEVLRVLRPEGKALVGDQQWVKPVPQGVDDWTHHYHGPDNNPQSRDRLARAPYLTQFIVEPRYAPAPQCAVAAGGRVFMAFGHVAWHQREEPWTNTLVALNGYNGTLLWKRPLTPGIMVDRSTLIATGRVVYLADDKSCKLLDAATGKLVDEITVPADLVGGTFWKWMALEGGTLYALVGPAEPLDPNAFWKSVRHGWPWDGISQGYNRPEYAWGFSKTLVAIDVNSKRILWSYQADPPIDSRSLCMKSGRIYCASFGHYIVCLDAKTGDVVWQRTAEKDQDVFSAIGPYRPGHGYIGGWKSTVYVKCSDEALYFVGPQVEWLTALACEDGRVLWRHPVKDLHLVIREDGLYVIGAQNSNNDQTQKLDPATGRVIATFATRRRACTRSTGSIDGIFFRAHEGSGRLIPTTGTMQWISPMRPSCHVGVVVANGHLYWAPWACDCNLQMFGAIALAPAGAFRFDQPATEAERLERLVAPDHRLARFEISPADWPTYRADPARTARTPATVGPKVQLLWISPPTPLAEPTAPVMAGGVVFVGGSDGIVRAIDAASGQVRWKAYTGGPIRFPPTLADGRLWVGSGDGWVYTLEAATGRLLWRFRAAPVVRRINVYGTLLSTWPVASGVLVDRGVAYFAAGISDLDGTHVYALDAATGKIVWQNNTSGHLDAASWRGLACQGELLLADGKLFLASGNYVSPGVFDVATGRCLNRPPDTMGTTAPRGRELHLVDGQVRVSGQPLYSLPEMPVYDPSTQWAPAIVRAADVELYCRREEGSGQAGWQLAARRRTDGQELWAQALPAEPVRWAVAVDAQGRIAVSLRSGQVACFGVPGPGGGHAGRPPELHKLASQRKL